MIFEVSSNPSLPMIISLPAPVATGHYALSPFLDSLHHLSSPHDLDSHVKKERKTAAKPGEDAGPEGLSTVFFLPAFDRAP